MQAWAGRKVTTVLWALIHIIICISGYAIINIPLISTFIGKELAQGIGASLIAAGVTGLLLYIYVGRTETLKSQIEVLQRAGISYVFNARSTRIKNEYDARTKDAKQVDIIGFGLSQLREDHSDTFFEWSRTKDVRILLLDPDFPSPTWRYSDQRDHEEKNSPGRIRSDIMQFAALVADSDSIDKNRFQVRYMTALPSINLFRFDDEIFWGPYLMNRSSRNTMTLSARRGGFVYQQLIEHFESIWTDYSRPIT